MFFSIHFKRAGWHWIWYRLISGKTLFQSSSHWRQRYWPNTSKHWEENNHFRNYWFPFGLPSLLRNFLHVNSRLGEFDQFGPHPNIAQAKLSGLTHQNQCNPIIKPRTYIAFLLLCQSQSESTDRHDQQLYLLDVNSFWSPDLFSHENPHQRLRYSKKVGNMASRLHVS